MANDLVDALKVWLTVLGARHRAGGAAVRQRGLKEQADDLAAARCVRGKVLLLSRLICLRPANVELMPWHKSRDCSGGSKLYSTKLAIHREWSVLHLMTKHTQLSGHRLVSVNEDVACTQK